MKGLNQDSHTGEWYSPQQKENITMRTSIIRADIIRQLLAATLALAIAFTFGCEEKTSGKAADNPKPSAEETAESKAAKEAAELAAMEAAAKAAAEAAVAAQQEAAELAKAEEAKAKETKEVASCKGGGKGDGKLLECITNNKGVLKKKFQYDEQNRIVKIYERYGYELEKEKISKSITITYNNDDLITVKKFLSDNSEYSTIKYVRKGNTITSDEGTTLTINEDGYIEGEGYQYKDGNVVNTEDCECSHDNKKSPLFNTNTPKWLLQKYGLFSANKNNILREYCSGAEISFSNDYKYEYDSDGFPTKETKKSYVEGEEGTEIIRFTYLGKREK